MPTLPKKLFAQVKDFTKLKGSRMSPEQTEAALKRLKESSFSPSGWEKRDEFVNSLKQTGLLKDPNIERVYAVGSSVTPKVDPTDLDIMYRSKTARATSKASDMFDDTYIQLEMDRLDRLYGKLDNEEDAAVRYMEKRQLHPIVPRITESYGDKFRFKPDAAFNRSANRTATEVAEVGAERYGSNHQWIRLVGIPAAVSLGLMTEEEAEAAFKPAEVAKATAKLLKHNAPRLREDAVLPQVGKPDTGTSGRLSGIVTNMLKVPQKEYSRIGGVEVQPYLYTHRPGFVRRGQLQGTRQHPIFKPIVELSAAHAEPGTAVHELAHARQMERPGVRRMLIELQEHINKWLLDPLDQYRFDAGEIHAELVESAVTSSPNRLTPTMYDEIYSNELLKAIRYTETFLQKMDPTFKARFLKNVAIGGAVMTALQLGPDEASAMPRGVYQAIDYGAQVLRKSRDAKKFYGRTMAPGKVIDTVVVTGENERRIRFTDGTESIVDKSDIHKLYKSFGTKDYEAAAVLDKDPVSQMTKAVKSLAFHEARYKQVPEKEALQYVDDYLRNLSEMGEHISPDIVFVQRGDKVFTMPRVYAELLEEQDLLKILRSDKYIELLDKYKVK